jgi:hypothetical protein
VKDLSLHLLDILENSSKAGGRAVQIDFDWHGTFLKMTIADDGPGFPESVRMNPTDPYTTTRTTRNVGFGLAFLQEAAEQTGGHIFLGKSQAGGVLIVADFDFSHADAKPIGLIEEAMVSAIAAWPHMDWQIRCNGNIILDTMEIRKELEGVPMQSPEILRFLCASMREDLQPLYNWADNTMVKF